MCGRFTVNYTYEQMLEYLDKEYSIFDFEFELPRFNVSPGQQVLSIISDGSKYRVGTFKWGLVPSFSKEETNAYKMINARSENIEEKISFKDSFLHKRCIVLSDGFYEWDKISGTKTPYYFTFENRIMMAYAGIWSRYVKDGIPIYTCSIITTKANTLVGEYHDRMPVILSDDKAKKWLSKDVSIQELQNLMTVYDSNKMNVIEVSKKVNSVQNDEPSLIEEFNELRLF